MPSPSRPAALFSPAARAAASSGISPRGWTQPESHNSRPHGAARHDTAERTARTRCRTRAPHLLRDGPPDPLAVRHPGSLASSVVHVIRAARHPADPPPGRVQQGQRAGESDDQRPGDGQRRRRAGALGQPRQRQ